MKHRHCKVWFVKDSERVGIHCPHCLLVMTEPWFAIEPEFAMAVDSVDAHALHCNGPISQRSLEYDYEPNHDWDEIVV